MEASYLDLLMAQQEEFAEEAAGGGGVWVVADVVNGALAPVTLEAMGLARLLADSLGAYVYGVLLGDGVTGLAQTLYQAGADGVRIADDPLLGRFVLEPYLKVLGDLFAQEGPEVVIFGATPQGNELAPRLAQRMNGGLIERVARATLDEATRTVQGAVPVYGGEYFELLACPEARPQFLTVMPGAFPMPFMDTHRRGEPVSLPVEPVTPRVRLLGTAVGFEPPPIPLRHAPVIVAAGRQAGDFELVRQLTVALGAQLAGDRGAYDAGWIGREQIVDVRGVTVAPQVYLAAGIRGDTFHNAAIEEARYIVAIHPDPEAPIFEVADLCVEAYPAQVLSELLAAMR